MSKESFAFPKKNEAFAKPTVSFNGSSEYIYPTPTHATYYYKSIPTFVGTKLKGSANVYYNETVCPIE